MGLDEIIGWIGGSEPCYIIVLVALLGLAGRNRLHSHSRLPPAIYIVVEYVASDLEFSRLRESSTWRLDLKLSFLPTLAVCST